jgi:hypothetical protein
VSDFKTYVAPGSKKWIEQCKIERTFKNSQDRKKTEQMYLTEIKIEECEDYSNYLPVAFPKINGNTEHPLVNPNDDPKGEYFHTESGTSGVNYSVEPNSWSDFWKTRRGKRTGYYLQYLNERKKTRERYERMRTTRENELKNVPASYINTAQQSYNRVAER